jgi:DNA adenine methylase
MCGDDEHRELLKALLGCQSAVVLSGYASPLYDDLLSAWSRREIATQTGNGGTARARVEVVWSNRPFPQGHLFDLGEAS